MLPMTFDELLALVSSENGPPVRIDSRLVRPGDIFVAVPGTVCDGHDFIDQAIARGAEYIVGRSAPDRCRIDPTRMVLVEDSAEAAALLAMAAVGNPAARLSSLAVTGTNGKTTVAFLVRSVFQQAGLKCGLIGTVIYDTCSGEIHEATLTTPDCLAIAEMTARMVQCGVKYMVVEASSHALSQSRLAGLSFTAAAFTNLAGDHLDYHRTQRNYLAAKARLFKLLRPDAVAVLNKQSPHSRIIARQTDAAILWYAVDAPAELNAQVKSMDTAGTTFLLAYAGQTLEVKTPLLGRYNVSNCLAAAGLCLAAGLDLKTIAQGLSAVQVIPGRLEKVDWGGDFSVLIDYAHTDDALKNVLQTLQPLSKGRLIVVFGCGGDRDRTKRPRMARVAEQLADIVVVTSDNPRTEPPETIITEILAGFENPPLSRAPDCDADPRNGQTTALKTILVEPDRKRAIQLAIKTAREGDILLIAGKGHETYQIIGEQKFHFSDREVVEEFLISSG